MVLHLSHTEIATADAVDAKTKRPTRLPVGRLSSDTQSGKHYVTPETHMTYAITWYVCVV